MELYLVRHTTPDIAKGVCYGRADIDVSANFVVEAEMVRSKLNGIAPSALYASPQMRCARLAESLDLGRPMHDERLMELHFGEWELRAWDDIPRDEFDRWGNAHVEQAPPGGESFLELHRRAKAFLAEISVLPIEASVLVVTHAGVIRALLAEALNLPLVEAFRFHLDFGSVTQLLVHERVLKVGYVNR